jgi:hypothetical protein
MKTYEVGIRATICKRLTIEAENEEDAIEAAHEQFSVLNDDIPENYDQETDFCREMKS